MAVVIEVFGFRQPALASRKDSLRRVELSLTLWGVEFRRFKSSGCDPFCFSINFLSRVLSTARCRGKELVADIEQVVRGEGSLWVGGCMEARGGCEGQNLSQRVAGVRVHMGSYRHVNSQGLQDAAAMKRRSSDLGDHLLVRLRAFDQRW